MTAQSVGDLRTLVTRRAGLNRRVALLASDGALVRALEQNGCTVLVDPPLDALDEFRPEVVAFDGFVAEGGEGFKLLAAEAPDAELVFSFANAASASSLLRGLLGATPPRSTSEADVRAWLSSAGYGITSRDLVVTPHERAPLAADTEAAVRQLLEQLNPDAAVDRLLLVARRGAPTAVTAPERTAGLVSVIVSGGRDAGALEGTLASLASQHQRPLELVVVTPLDEAAAARALNRVRGRAQVTLVTERVDSDDAAKRTNAGLAHARGQYLAFLEAGELLDPRHLAALVRTLEQGTAAWALSPADASTVADCLATGAVHHGRWLIDRERVATFPLSFAEGTPLFEAVFFARLAALFPPAWLTGAQTFDTTRKHGDVRGAVVEAMRARPLRALTTLEELTRRPAPPSVQAVIHDELEARSPVAAKAFDRAASLVARVRAKRR